MSHNIKILICTHKEVELPDNELFLPVQVGASLSERHWGIQKDDDGYDNISYKNKNYCELTAHYWAWKNLKDCGYIGLCHYRRFFDMQYDESLLMKKLKKYDIILPRPIVLPHNNLYNLNEVLTREDVYILLQCLKTLYPNYWDAAKNYMASNKNIACNMFITSFEIFKDYSEWLFTLLEKTEKFVRLSEYTRLRRIYGYFSEFLLPIYMLQKGLKVNFVPITSYPGIERNHCVKDKLRDVVNSTSFKIWRIANRDKEYKPIHSTLTGLEADNIIIK